MAPRIRRMRERLTIEDGNTTKLTPDELAFCDRLREERYTKRGLSLDDLSRISGVGRSTIQDIELRNSGRSRALMRPNYTPTRRVVRLLMAAIAKVKPIEQIRIEPLTQSEIDRALATEGVLV